VSRLDRAAADTSGLKNLGASVARGVVSLVLTLFVFSLAGWPDDAAGVWLTFAVFVAGFFLSIGLEFGFNYVMADGRLARAEVETLREENAELQKNRQDVEALRRLQEQQDAAYREQHARLQQAIEVVEAQNGVLWGVYREQVEGVQVPIAAVMARMESRTQVITQDFGDARTAQRG
jgi:hypothetical protein